MKWRKPFGVMVEVVLQGRKLSRRIHGWSHSFSVREDFLHVRSEATGPCNKHRANNSLLPNPSHSQALSCVAVPELRQRLPQPGMHLQGFAGEQPS